MVTWQNMVLCSTLMYSPTLHHFLLNSLVVCNNFLISTNSACLSRLVVNISTQKSPMSPCNYAQWDAQGLPKYKIIHSVYFTCKSHVWTGGISSMKVPLHSFLGEKTETGGFTTLNQSQNF